MKVRKAVIPAAGLGTRVLPASKALPKEMLPIVDKPAIQFLVEECVRSGIEDILIITNRNKVVIEDHFDRTPELEQSLAAAGRQDELDALTKISDMANLHFIRQKQALGLGHAISCARSFVGDEPFAVLYGDDIVIGDSPACAELIAAWDAFGLGVVGIKPVPMDQLSRYSSMQITPIRDRMFTITDMIEKPAPGKEFSNYAILGRCVLPPEIFDLLQDLPRGAGNEYQLTDAMRILAREKQMIGVQFTGTRYDMGNKLGIMQAGVQVALSHPEIGPEFRAYLRSLTL